MLSKRFPGELSSCSLHSIDMKEEGENWETSDVQNTKRTAASVALHTLHQKMARLSSKQQETQSNTTKERKKNTE